MKCCEETSQKRPSSKPINSNEWKQEKFNVKLTGLQMGKMQGFTVVTRNV